MPNSETFYVISMSEMDARRWVLLGLRKSLKLFRQPAPWWKVNGFDEYRVTVHYFPWGRAAIAEKYYGTQDQR